MIVICRMSQIYNSVSSVLYFPRTRYTSDQFGATITYRETNESCIGQFVVVRVRRVDRGGGERGCKDDRRALVRIAKNHSNRPST